MGSCWSSQRGGALYRMANGDDAWTNVLAGSVSAVAFSRNFAINQTAFAAVPDTAGRLNAA